jgi:uncharacterized membrane protein YhaH (DUF805 family)
MFLKEKINEWSNNKGCYNRMEYFKNWGLAFIILIVSISVSALIIMASKILGVMFLGIFLIIFTFFNINLTTKRLHGIGHSGWWQLLLYVPIIGMIFAFFVCFYPSSDPENNIYCNKIFD